MDRFHVGERRQHHFDFGWLEDARVALHVVVVHFHVGLREEAKNLRQQITFIVGQPTGPIFTVFTERDFLGHPVDLLLELPIIVRPRIAKRFIADTRGHQARQ